MRVRVVLACMVAVVMLTGCAAGSVREIKNDPANKTQFVVDQNYQRVYKNLLDKMNECMGEGWVGLFAQMHIRHVLLNELRTAEVSYAMSNLGAQNYYLHVDISAIENDRSNVAAYVFFSTWRHVLPKVEMWSSNPESACN